MSVTIWRFWLGRHLVHLGLFIMPRGRARAELYDLFEAWGYEAQYQIRQHGAAP